MRRWNLAASSARSAFLQMIPMNATMQVMAAYVVIVAMASMGGKLAREQPFPEVPKVTESAETDMTLVTHPADQSRAVLESPLLGDPPALIAASGLNRSPTERVDQGGNRMWSGRESNPRPSHCERDALPTELPPQTRRAILAS